MSRAEVVQLAQSKARESLTAQTQEALEDIAASAFCQSMGVSYAYHDDIACFYTTFVLAMVCLGKAPFLLNQMVG